MTTGLAIASCFRFLWRRRRRITTNLASRLGTIPAFDSIVLKGGGDAPRPLPVVYPITVGALAHVVGDGNHRDYATAGASERRSRRVVAGALRGRSRRVVAAGDSGGLAVTTSATRVSWRPAKLVVRVSRVALV